MTISNVAMKPLIAILTGLHVLAHGIFGCCDHGLVAPSRAAPSCACHHAHHDDQHVPSSNPHDVADVEQPAQVPHQCVHASCHWLASSVGKLINMPDFSTPIPLVASLPKSCLALQAADFWPDIATDGTSAPPLRLHLALGVLRI